MKHSIGVLALALTLPAALRAQQAEALPIPTPMEERVLVQLVQLPILARDRQGRPVADLRPDEIEVKLRGREMVVSYLDPLFSTERPRGPLPEVRLYLDAPGGWTVPVATAPSEPRYVAILLDNENDDPLRRQEALSKTLEFVETRLGPDIRTAVLSYAGDLAVELPFTTDRNALKSALLRASSRQGRPRVARETGIRQLLDRLDDCALSRSDFGSTADPQCLRDVANEYLGETRPRAVDFVRALDQLVRYLAGLRGQKSVLVMSHGVPVDPTLVIREAARALYGNPEFLSQLQLYMTGTADARALLDRLLEDLVRNRITVNFLDRAAPPSGDFSAKRGAALAPGIFPMRAEYDAAVADMEQIAYTSGGIHVRSTDVSEGLQDVFDAQRGSYELGFQTAEYLDADKLAKIKVDCKRSGVKILHRRGVYANPPQSELRLKGGFAFGKNRPLQGARAPGIHQPFLIEVEAEQLGYEVGEASADADFTVHLAVLLTGSGTSLADTYHFVSHSYERPYWDAPDRPPVTLSGWVELPPGEYTLRAWFRNVRNGREGVVSQAVAVPAPKAEGAQDTRE